MPYRDPCRQSFENPLRKLRRQMPSWGGGVQSAHLKRLWTSRGPVMAIYRQLRRLLAGGLDYFRLADT